MNITVHDLTADDRVAARLASSRAGSGEGDGIDAGAKALIARNAQLRTLSERDAGAAYMLACDLVEEILTPPADTATTRSEESAGLTFSEDHALIERIKTLRAADPGLSFEDAADLAEAEFDRAKHLTGGSGR